MLSQKTKYALHALMALAEHEGEKPFLIAELAGQEGIPKKFLEQILLELKNKGILQSKKGKGGGYFLGREPEDIHLGEVVRLLDGPLAPLPCASLTAFRKCDECPDEKSCSIRAVMKEVRDATSAILDQETLADMLERNKKLKHRKKGVLIK